MATTEPEVSLEEKMRIAGGFLVESPPGEFHEVSGKYYETTGI